MLNCLSSTTFDPDGYIELHVANDQTIGETRRRVNRVTTLDGGVAVNDFGFSQGDRTIDLSWMPTSEEVEENVRRMVELYQEVIVSMRGGVFRAAPESYQPGASESVLRLLVLERVSA